MLVLTRRSGESVRIGDEIEIKILAIDGNQVRIGFNAPREVKIVRTEIIGKSLKPEHEYKHRAYGARPDGTLGEIDFFADGEELEIEIVGYNEAGGLLKK